MVFRTGMLLMAAAASIWAAGPDESFEPPGRHPALLLDARHLRLLRRERERGSPRWQQFESLIAGSAPMPEPGFALALYYQVAGDEAAGRRAVEWVLGDASDLRQLALVFDWCQPVMSEAQSAALARKLRSALDRPPGSSGIPEARSRVFAAIALSNRAPEVAERELQHDVLKWYRGGVAAALVKGQDMIPRADQYALLEILHAVRDNLSIDLREAIPDYFRQLSICNLLSYYPAPKAAPENDYRIPASRIPASRSGEPSFRKAMLARAADLALVAYDSNALGSQFLQGWLIHDRFVMRGAFGSPYEFLWANPYLPGIGYDSAPLSVHDAMLGRLFVRSGWDDDALWAGYFDGQLQVFSGGAPKVIESRSMKVLRVGETVIAPAAVPSSPVFDDPLRELFLVGLNPSQAYLLGFGRNKALREVADPSGILALNFPEPFHGTIRIREARKPAGAAAQ